MTVNQGGQFGGGEADKCLAGRGERAFVFIRYADGAEAARLKPCGRADIAHALDKKLRHYRNAKTCLDHCNSHIVGIDLGLNIKPNTLTPEYLSYIVIRSLTRNDEVKLRNLLKRKRFPVCKRVTFGEQHNEFVLKQGHKAVLP